MVSRARLRSNGTSKGKRRAVSPAHSDSSDNAIGEAWVASRTKRVKSEPPDEFDVSPKVAVEQEIDGDDAAEATIVVKRQADSSDEVEEDDTHIEDEDKDNDEDEDTAIEAPPALTAPADLLEILSTARTDTKKFQGRIEEVVDNSFKIAAEADEVPGQRYIDCVLNSLKGIDVASGRVEEVSQHLCRTRRHKIAEHLGSIISSNEELRETLNAVVAGLPFRIGHNGFLFRPPTNNQPDTPAAARIETQETSPNEIRRAADDATAGSSSDTREAEKQAKRESCEKESGVDAAVPRSNNESSEMPNGQTTQRSQNNEVNGTGTGNGRDRQASESQEATFKEQFPRTFDLFFHYAKPYLKLTNGEDCEGLRGHVRTVFDALEKDKVSCWRRVYKRARAGDSLEETEICPALLAEQQIPEKLQNICIPSARLEASLRESSSVGKVSMQPLLIPVPSSPKNINALRHATVVVNTPEAPRDGISRDQLIGACVKAVGDASTVQKVEKANDHVWTITFVTPEVARNAKGRKLDLGGARIEIEHLFPKPPLIFICDFSDVNVEDEEIARRLAEAFAKNGTKPLVRMQEHKKLYIGRFLWVTLPSSERLIRFYIPMLRADSKEVFTACFKPVNKTVPCALCRYMHGTDPCSASRSIELPVN